MILATLDTGEALTELRYQQERLEACCTKALAPGQPVELKLTSAAEGELRIQAKSLGSKRRDEHHYCVTLKPINLSRQARSTLLRMLAGG